MKKLLIFGLILCLLAGIVSAQDISVQDGKIVGEDTYKLSFWDSLWSGQAFSFVGNPGEVRLASSNICSVGQSSGTLSHLGGTSKQSGEVCSVGQYIAFIAASDSTDGTIKKGQYIFDQLWYKSSSTELVSWLNYPWVAQKAFTYYYVCLSCQQLDSTDTERGCLSADKLSCVTKSDPKCSINYNYQGVCLSHISSSVNAGSSGTVPSGTTAATTEPKIEIGDVQVTNGGSLKQGQLFEIKGMAYVTGQATNAIIETGFTSDYFTPLTISAAGALSKGVCGDDLTTGVKFTAANTWVVFTLPMRAEKAGKQRLKIIASPACGSGIIYSTKYVDLNVAEATSTTTVDTTVITNECANNPNAVSCAPQPCVGAECDLTPCTTNCGGGATIVTEPNKPAPNWFSTQNMIIATVGMAILIAMAIGLNKKRKRK